MPKRAGTSPISNVDVIIIIIIIFLS